MVAGTGPTTLDGNVTTTGAQSYGGTVTLGATDALTTTNSTVQFLSTVNAATTGVQGLDGERGDRGGDFWLDGGRVAGTGEPDRDGHRTGDARRQCHDDRGAGLCPVPSGWGRMPP